MAHHVHICMERGALVDEFPFPELGNTLVTVDPHVLQPRIAR